MLIPIQPSLRHRRRRQEYAFARFSAACRDFSADGRKSDGREVSPEDDEPDLDQETFMTRRKLNILPAIGLLLASLTSSSAQVAAPGSKLPLARTHQQAGESAAKTDAAASPAYQYTLVSYPGTLNTLGVGMNLDAYGQDQEINVVGAWFFPDESSQSGFLARLFGRPTATETYTSLNERAEPTPQQAYSINDFGQVVGDFIDDSGSFRATNSKAADSQCLACPLPALREPILPPLTTRAKSLAGGTTVAEMLTVTP
jgi:hypothetical protein